MLIFFITTLLFCYALCSAALAGATQTDVAGWKPFIGFMLIAFINLALGVALSQQGN